MKKKGSGKIKFFLFSFMVIIFLCVLFIFAGYRRMKDGSRDFATSVQKGVNMSLQRVWQTANKDGVPAWKLSADSVSYMNGQQQAVFENPFLTFFLKDNQEARLMAAQGIVKTDSNDLRISGNVRMESDSYTMETRELKYQHEKQLFFSDAPVKITGKDMNLSADSATLDLNAGKVFFKGNVKGIFGENISL